MLATLADWLNRESEIGGEAIIEMRNQLSQSIVMVRINLRGTCNPGETQLNSRGRAVEACG